jgi:predicted nuclease of restriction endonuclease-like (RecB) superfamily
MRIENNDEKSFYEIETLKNNWSVRELERQYNSSLYERLKLSKDKDAIMKLSKEGQIIEKPKDIIKNPYVLEFLGLEEKTKYTESDLETSIIDKLQKFLMELGKGFLFDSRQKRIMIGEKNFYIDMVFYHRILKCFVLIDLKIGEITHQDIGQMQMYVNYYDRFIKNNDENRTIGIILCKEKNDSVVEITLPKENEQIFAAKYQLYLPSKEELIQQLESING